MSSPSSTPGTPGSAPKSMSSRLLTMKFMQRAAASTPISSSPTPDEPSPKRQKKNSDAPIKPRMNVDALADQRAVQAALDAEEAKRQVALDKQAADAGDTRWVLSYEDQEKSALVANGGLRIIQAGYANLDIPTPQPIKLMDEEDLADRPAMVGRRSFAKFNKALERAQGSLEDSSDSDSDSSSEDEDSSEPNEDVNDPMKELITAARLEAAQKLKAERRAKRKAEKAQLQEFSKKRKKREVRLNTNMTSLTGRQDRPDTRACFICGGPHLKVDCPRNQNGTQNGAQKRFYQGGDDGPSPKVRKVR